VACNSHLKYKQHWPWGTQVVGCFQHGGEFCCQRTCHQLFVFVMMTLFGPLFGTEANTNRILGTSL